VLTKCCLEKRKKKLKKALALVAMFLIVFSMTTVLAPKVRADTPPPEIRSPHIAQGGFQLIFGLDSQNPDSYATLQMIAANYSCEIIGNVRIEGAVVAATVNMTTAHMNSFISDVNAAGIATYIEPRAEAKVFMTPNDPSWLYQWGPKKVHADWAWNGTTGDRSVLVAVIDTGIDYSHPDLAANYVPLGYDWVNGDPDPKDDYGHGTHCAGIIAAEINNNKGIAGLAQVRIMAEKVLNEEGGGYCDWIANGIIHATNQGAKIISMSLGGSFADDTLYTAIKYAHDKGVLLVAASGNDNSNQKSYPAAYPEVVAVAATNENDNPAFFTNYGDWIELAAPGVNIYSTMPTYHVTMNDEGFGMNYDYVSGTSMACPHVAGVAALVLSRYANMTGDDVRNQLRSTTDDLGDAGFDETYGWGRINARRATGEAGPLHDLAILSWQAPSYILPGQSVHVNTTVQNLGAANEVYVRVALQVYGIIANETVIDVMPSGAITTTHLSWTPPNQPCVYKISSYVAPVPGETMTSNNKATTTLRVRNPVVLKVPGNYTTIQSAVDAAIPLDTIQVSSGTYHEHVVVNKPQLSIIGQNRNTTIIDGSRTDAGVSIFKDHVTVSGFTIQNGDPYGFNMLLFSNWNSITGNKVVDGEEGIYLYYCSDNIIKSNILTRNYDCAILLVGASRNSISQNTMTLNAGFGVAVLWGGSGNKIYKNIITFNDWDGIIGIFDSGLEICGNKLISNGLPQYCGGIASAFGEGGKIEGNLLMGNGYGVLLNQANGWTIYRNSFINSTIRQVDIFESTVCWSGRWNVTGNYWSDYTGTNWNSYKVGTTPYTIGGVYDQNPLMCPYLPGDVYHDGKVDIRDISIVSRAYGSRPGMPGWNPHADLNEDGVVDVKDTSTASANFGKTWQTYWGV
jgi:thermitase